MVIFELNSVIFELNSILNYPKWGRDWKHPNKKKTSSCHQIRNIEFTAMVLE